MNAGRPTTHGLLLLPASLPDGRDCAGQAVDVGGRLLLLRLLGGRQNRNENTFAAIWAKAPCSKASPNLQPETLLLLGATPQDIQHAMRGFATENPNVATFHQLASARLVPLGASVVLS